jgi:RimJ/RimL family protein N-acetyltransferase
MRREETITYLEMTAPDQLRPARPAPDVRLKPADAGDPSGRSTLERIGRPHQWPCLSWSDDEWDRWLWDVYRLRWTIRSGDEIAGLVELDVQADGDVELVTFGLFPEFVGRGVGGHALTLTTRLAWNLDPAVRRVWLHTSSLDHPNALPNYRSRGFRPYRTEVRQRG